DTTTASTTTTAMAIASFTSSPLRSRKESPLSSLSHWCERKEIRQQADRLAGADTSMVRAACRELTIMKGRPPEARAGVQGERRPVLAGQGEGERTGNRFDPARCPKQTAEVDRFGPTRAPSSTLRL